MAQADEEQRHITVTSYAFTMSINMQRYIIMCSDDEQL